MSQLMLYTRNYKMYNKYKKYKLQINFDVYYKI